MENLVVGMSAKNQRSPGGRRCVGSVRPGSRHVTPVHPIDRSLATSVGRSQLKRRRPQGGTRGPSPLLVLGLSERKSTTSASGVPSPIQATQENSRDRDAAAAKYVMLRQLTHFVSHCARKCHEQNSVATQGDQEELHRNARCDAPLRPMSYTKEARHLPLAQAALSKLTLA